MNEIISINYENDNPTVSGRELHKALEVKTPYTQWFERMAEYGFEESKDFTTVHKNVIRSDGSIMPQIQIDHFLMLSMAKELCMLQRNDKGKFFRKYFIQIEEAWNNPETLLKRAIQYANTELEKIKVLNYDLAMKNEILVAETLTWADRPLINSIVRRYAANAFGSDFALAWTDFKKELLYRHSINVNSRLTAYINKSGKKSKPKTLDMLTDDELVVAIKTIVSMCESKKIDVSDLLRKQGFDLAV